VSVVAPAGVWRLSVERGAVGDALPPGRPAPVDRRRPRRQRPVVGLAALVVPPPDVQPPQLLGVERVVGAGPVVAGALRPDGEG
jgi:hypothetical protein